MNQPCILILYYTSIGKYALNAIAGALESCHDTIDIPIEFPNNAERLKTAIETAIQKNKKIIVGWSFYTANFIKSKKLLTSLKQNYQYSDLYHIAGGVHATAEPLQTLKAGFDYVACGEGENTIVDIMRLAAQGKSFKRIRGLAYLENDKMQFNGRGKNITLDDYLPVSVKYKKFGALEITRGCIYACKFCQTPFINKARFRHRSIKNIQYNISLLHQCGLKDYRFLTPTALSYASDNESINLDALEEMLAKIREIIGPNKRLFYGTFPSEVRPEHISIPALKILKRYVNNDNLIIGGQSGSQRMLDLTHRGHNVSVIEQAVRHCIKVGFVPNVDFLFGMPGESETDAAQTRDLMQKLTELGAKIHSHTFMPLPGTPFRNEKPGNIDKLTQKKIKTLSAQGKAYGQWQDQMKLAQNMADMRDKKNSC